jgi:hypothetical protein
MPTGGQGADLPDYDRSARIGDNRLRACSPTVRPGTRYAGEGEFLSALADAEARIRLCEAAIEILEPLAGRLRHALARSRVVPSDLGETYESVYSLIRRGGAMPAPRPVDHGARNRDGLTTSRGHGPAGPVHLPP